MAPVFSQTAVFQSVWCAFLHRGSFGRLSAAHAVLSDTLRVLAATVLVVVVVGMGMGARGAGAVKSEAGVSRIIISPCTSRPVIQSESCRRLPSTYPGPPHHHRFPHPEYYYPQQHSTTTPPHASTPHYTTSTHHYTL